MAKRNPLKAKVHAANVRENKHLNRETRDDGVLRRHDKEPLTVVEQRAKSRTRKVWVSARQRWAHEVFVRARRGEDYALKREEFLPIKHYRPGTGAFTGRYQSTKEEV